ncbi:hypothetical protein [uncultured Piscinibacter sp.]|uniref:hypothetical protein n=1 Tax=uncultured Piscinibacter sp. TaxID=1131835 RepID=UPI002613DC60|nr:hypothetical protein [uncultured Piscinibacter sp.]
MTEAQAALLSQMIMNLGGHGSALRVGSGVAGALASGECELPTRADGGQVTHLFGLPVVLDDTLAADEVVLVSLARMRLGTLNVPPRAQPEPRPALQAATSDWRDTVRQRGAGQQAGGL